MARKVRFGLVLSLALATGTFLLVPKNAVAQQPAPTEPANAAPAAGNEEMQKITVTGYLVPRVGEGPQPVITLDQDFISRQGDQTVSEVIQRLPQNSQAFTPLVNPGASFSPAASEVNLYGLGTGSTLVLIDGKRQTIFPFPQNGFQSFVDLNSIPLAAVDRIEILKDGASSIYGSDAIAGVVNVIMKDDYNGGDISAYWGISQRGDDEVYHVQATAGISKNLSDTSKFSLLAAFDYYENSPIDAVDREFSTNVNHSLRGRDLVDNRSFSPPAGNFFGLSTGNQYSVVPGTRGPNIAPNNLVVNGDGNFYNTVPGVQLLPRETKYGTYLKMTYQPLQYLQVYDEFSYQYNREMASFTATPVTGSDFIVTPADNPFNPTGEDLDTRLRLLEFGQRKVETIIENVRNVAGIRLINLPKNWFLDASLDWAETDGHQHATNNVSKSALQAALNGTLPGFAGQFFNPFIDQSVVSSPNRQFVNALKIFTDDHARTNLTQWSANAGGEVVDLPGGPITVGLGGEYRSNEYIDYKSSNQRNADVVALGGSGNASGKDYLTAAYGELTIPILGGKWSWPGARVLEIVASERYDNYSSFGEAWKPKFSIRYKPFDDLTFRASYSEGFRAPSVTELFSAQLSSFLFVTDPRVPSPPNGNAYEVELTTVGNPNLRPETAYSYYAGAIWTPGAKDPEHSWWGWANGFTAYADWTEILKRNVINQINAQFVINNPALFPGAITRDGFGNILSVQDPLENLGAVRVDAFDFGASYSTKEFAWGKINIGADATYYYHVSQQNTVGGQVLNVTDSLAPSFPVSPDFKLTASLFYTKTLFGIDTFQTGITFNFIDSEHDVNDYRGLGLTLAEFVAASGLPDTHVVGNWSTFDWQISYEFGKPAELTPEAPPAGYDKDGKRVLGEKAISPKPEGRSEGWRRWIANTKFTFGINNIFDTKPPFSDLTTTGFDSTSASPIQRYFYLQLEKKF
jgi:iron complex outermembrane receptor protein